MLNIVWMTCQYTSAYCIHRIFSGVSPIQCDVSVNFNMILILICIILEQPLNLDVWMRGLCVCERAFHFTQWIFHSGWMLPMPSNQMCVHIAIHQTTKQFYWTSMVPKTYECFGQEMEKKMVFVLTRSKFVQNNWIRVSQVNVISGGVL